ncbi:probable disease resistance protein At4g27220 isoform X2 [Citrus sinensis]|uniref:probable disease resistance protein At4g27220 isoform X2 n=1 Tax=Citrus sinensis TaxID=2711 RepID=UPI0022798E44|nr:probable disease resistance protein At4g27220 isoform X2 [Citrus sinensis]
MVDAVVTVALEVAKCLFPPIGRQLSYVRKYKANLENLKKETEKLTDARDSMQKKVDDARRNGEEIDKRVESWLISVDKIIAKADTLTGEEEHANKKCFKWLCPNLKKRYQLSEKAAAKEKSIADLKEEAEKFAQISYPTVAEEPWLRSGKGCEAFASRTSTLKDVQNALLDPDISIIGVYGMGGVGKTTLVKEVARRAKKGKLFDEVVFAEVSETPDIRKVQEELADQLGMKFDEGSDVPGRARRLYARLQNENKILAILDNIWEELDLEKVGVPSGNDCRGCKVLLTARDRHVLESIGSKTLGIDVLSDEEAWTLFKKMVGDCAENGELKSIATDVAKECGGLPIAIVTLAKSLRNKSSVSTWKDALRQLKSPSPWNFKGVLAKTYSAIELSYNYLREEELKQLFLQCSLMGSPQASMQDLLKYAIGLGILKGVSTVEEARNKVNTLVDQLKDACLLLDGTNSYWFSVHDVVRDVAISIASRDYHVFTMRNEGDPRQWPDKKCSRISLYDNTISEIPQGWECPQLEFFYIFAPNNSPLKIPDNIFIGMPKLKVLDFTRMRLLSLPSSIHLLTDLRTLCLDSCQLEDIRVIGELRKLEILSLQASVIEQLPMEIGQLTQLKLLDLSYCSKLKVIAPNVLSNLSQLEELYMARCYIKWEHLGLSIERSNASLVELKNLSRLTTLEINILDAGILPSGFFSRKLERYRIVVGSEWDRFDKYKTRRTLKLKLNSRTCLEEWRGMKNVEYLCLQELPGLTNVLHDLDGEDFAELKHLNIRNNPNLLRIVDPLQVRCGAFPMLESLVLKNLINLERICHGHLQAESFCNLKTIKVESCHKLKKLFSFSTTKFLLQLGTIEVTGCNNVEEIFFSSNEEAIGEIALAQVRFLILRTLPLFTSFSAFVKTTSTVEAKHNEIILENENHIYTHPSLFNEKLVLPNLEVLEVRDINVAKIWHNQLSAVMSCNVQNLTRLVVEDCCKLRYVFSYSTAKRLGQLQHLVISRCPLLEEIVGKEGGVEADPSFVFPQLTILKLSSLPKLRAFYPGIHTLECPILTRLEVSLCDKLESFSSESYSLHENNEEGQLIEVPVPAQQPLFLVEKVLPNLEELRLSKNKDIAKIWQGPFPDHLLNKLEVLAIENDESEVLSPDLLERFHNLVSLQLERSSYKELFSNEGQVEKHVGKLAQIKHLKLRRLNDLKHLWLREQNSKLNTVFQNLETLSAHFCLNLTNLMPSSASFRCLKELRVCACEHLINLVASSAAKNLVQLVHVSVSECSKITELVVASEGDAANNEIIFPKLEYLNLHRLQSLTTFCSANYTFKFLSLWRLSVSACPKMKIFCGGVFSAPRLKEVWLNGQNFWDGDLNTTIQLSYYKTNAQSSTDDSGANKPFCFYLHCSALALFNFCVALLKVLL